MKAKNLAELYDLPVVEWDQIEARLEQNFTQAPETGGPNRHTCWLATINPDGTPHMTGVGAIFLDGACWFETGAESRKGRNLARDPRCALSVSAREFDLTLEGEAHMVTEPERVAELAALWAAEGWPARVDESGMALTAEFSAPSAGPPPWHVYRLEPRSATVLTTIEPGGATRFTF
jgi:PPOX class probable F420-dependent enzyme